MQVRNNGPAKTVRKGCSIHLPYLAPPCVITQHVQGTVPGKDVALRSDGLFFGLLSRKRQTSLNKTAVDREACFSKASPPGGWLRLLPGLAPVGVGVTLCMSHEKEASAAASELEPSRRDRSGRRRGPRKRIPSLKSHIRCAAPIRQLLCDDGLHGTG